MSVHTRILIVWSVVLLLITLLSRRTIAAPYISEAMWMGSELSSSDEWIEVTCRDEEDTEDAEDTEDKEENVQQTQEQPFPAAVVASCPVDISHWTLTSMNSSGIEVPMFSFPAGTTISDGEHILISNFDAEHSRILAEPQFVTTDVSLPNTKLLLRLRDASGAIVDSADDGAGDPIAGSNTSSLRASMERVRFDLPGNDSAAWATAALSCGFDIDAPLKGTPGFGPSCERFSSVSFVSSVSFSSSAASSSSIPNPTPTPTPTPTPHPHPLRLSELLPNPPGSDAAEWIELVNTGELGMDFKGISVRINGKTSILTSSREIGPGQRIVLQASDESFVLPNGGATIELLSGTDVIDTVTYGALPENISIGRLSTDGPAEALCEPTMGLPNSRGSLELILVRQSGELEGKGAVSINVGADLRRGNPSGLACLVDFGDGTSRNSCNPGSHSFDDPGEYFVELSAADFCGNTAEDTLVVSVYDDAKPKKKASTSSARRTTPKHSLRDVPVMITAAFPNPPGPDSTGEWIEMTNMTDEPQSLHEWSLGIDGGMQPMMFRGVQLASREVRRFPIDRTFPMPLPNLETELLLADASQNIVSRLAWKRVEEGSVVASERMKRFAAFVESVTDGDTFTVRFTRPQERTFLPRTIMEMLARRPNVAVRLLGSDAAEDTEYPERFFEERNFLRALLEEKNIELEFDTELVDAYGRILAYAFLPSGVDVSEEMLSRGYGEAIRAFSYAKKDEYLALEEDARNAGVGRWKGVSLLERVRSDTHDDSQSAVISSFVEKRQRSQCSPTPSQILISELLPAPSTGPEWIELWNPSDHSVDLSGCFLDDSDGGSKPWMFPEGIVLASREYRVFENSVTKLALNNTGDSVRLLSSDGTIFASVEFPKMKNDFAYALDADAMYSLSPRERDRERGDGERPTFAEASVGREGEVSVKTVNVPPLPLGERDGVRGIDYCFTSTPTPRLPNTCTTVASRSAKSSTTKTRSKKTSAPLVRSLSGLTVVSGELSSDQAPKHSLPFALLILILGTGSVGSLLYALRSQFLAYIPWIASIAYSIKEL